MSIFIDTNEFQTPITNELLDSLPKEVKEEFIDLVSNVEFIKRLISPKRKRAKDLPRDEDGKIIVDVTNPHILEDMDYFRPVAICYTTTGKLCPYRENANPNSPYGKWLTEEKRRIWEGMVRESDGEWIPGEMYFYLNYMPMEIAVKAKGRKGKMVVNRVTSVPRSWEGIYLWFHYLYQARFGGMYDEDGGNNGIQIATRGASKSFSCASMLARLFICGDNEDTKSHVSGVIMAAAKETLTRDGTLNKFEKCIDFCAEYSQFPAKRLLSSLDKMVWEMGYLEAVTGIKKGTQNMITGLSVDSNPDKGRGKRAAKIIYEEIGAFPKFLDTWSTNEPSVKEGDETWGQQVGIGTGGSTGSNFYGILEMLYNPIGYAIYPLPNVYDKNAKGKGKTIFFFGAYLNREGFYTHDGVSDVVGAIINILKNRYKVKYNSSDPLRLTRVIAERPLTIQEAIMKKGASLFPTAQLTERLNEIDNNPSEYDDVYTGRMTVSSTGEIAFNPDTSEIIRNFPHQDNKLDGGVEIYVMPEKDHSGKVFPNRYISSLDPVDDDTSETMSLQSCHVLDLWTDSIVAEYTGRPMFADTYYEQFRLLILFYNASCNYENNKKGVFAYMSKMNSLYMLTDTLDFLRDKEMIKGNLIGNKNKGTNATSGINNYARTLIRNWLISPIEIQKEVDGVVETVKVPRLNKLRSRALIQELIQWNSSGNFDRVSSLGMLMLLREDRMIAYGGQPEKGATEVASDYLGNDSFFTDNYSVDKDNDFK